MEHKGLVKFLGPVRSMLTDVELRAGYGQQAAWSDAYRPFINFLFQLHDYLLFF